MDFFQFIVDWYNSEVYALIKEFVSWMGYKIVVWKITVMIFTLDIAYNIASLLIADLGIAQRLSDAVGAISATTKNYLNYFNVFTGIQWILQSLLSKFILKFVGL